jgi:hypothetical protein
MPKCYSCGENVPLQDCIQQQVKAGSIGTGLSWRSGSTRKSNNQRGRTTSSHASGKWGWNSGRNLFKTVNICKECVADMPEEKSSGGCLPVIVALCLVVGFCTLTKTSDSTTPTVDSQSHKDSTDEMTKLPEATTIPQQSSDTTTEAAVQEKNGSNGELWDQKIEQDSSDNQENYGSAKNSIERKSIPVEETKEAINPNITSLSTQPVKQTFIAHFEGQFGKVVAIREYPTETMKNQALDLWSQENNILELDGSITQNKLPSKSSTNPLTGY